jgi:Zinc carboxypeptidase
LRYFALLAVLACLACTSPAESVNVLSPSTKYNPAIPTPESVLGYKIGEAFTSYSQLEIYFQKLTAAASDRMKMQAYGKSVEGRTLYTIFITSPKNLARLEQLRQSWLKLADPRLTNSAEVQAIASQTPVLVWLSYNVHGNEPSSSEAAMQVAYELAASEDPNVLQWLENCVIVIDPVLNPDGRDRYVDFYRQWVGSAPRSDRFAAEHQERWPGGRVNHYLFDLNRDWAWQSQPETIARIATIRRWMPQVVIDFHEMSPSATYFFPPPAKPVLPILAPLLGKWFETYGKGNAAAFDKFHFPYYTHETYDLFYPSYGDIWPSLNGAVGMTYEQGGGGAAGLAYDLPDHQRTLTLRDRVSHHFVSSLATINTSSQNREARLADFAEFHRAAIDAGQKGATRAYYIVPGRDPQRTAHLVDLLLKEGIEVKRSTADIDVNDATDYWGERSNRKRLPAGTYVVDAAQPAGFLARALLEREFAPEAVFFYDVSSWSLPLLADVEAYSSTAGVPSRLQPVTSTPSIVGGIEGSAQAAAYIVPIEQTAGLRLLSRLLTEDVKTYISLRPMKFAGRQYAAGSIIIPADSNSQALSQRLQEMARATGAQVFATSTLLSDEGVDLGSSRVRFLRKPRIAVLTDSPVNASDYGALWFLFEQRADIPFTPIRTEELRSVELRDYNVLILPPDNGDGRGYSRVLDKSLTSRINDWVHDGGLLIGIRGGAVWATKNKSGITSVTYHFVRSEDEQARIQEERAAANQSAGDKDKKDTTTETRERPASAESSARSQADIERKVTRYTDRERQRRAEDIPGALLRVTLDTSHPLAFGMNNRLAVLDDTAPILDLSAKGENPGYFPKDNLKVSGFLTPENEKKLAQTAYLIRERVGRGSVVLFADTPVFRGFSDGTTRLLLNAVFFGNIVDPNIP